MRGLNHRNQPDFCGEAKLRMEREIIDLFWKREESAIRKLDQVYGRFCYSISYQLLKNREDADECLNDTWLRTWNTIPELRPVNLKAYVAKIIRNLSLNRLDGRNTRKRGGGEPATVYEELQEIIGDRDPIAEVIDRQAFTEILNRFLDRLDEVERNVFVLRFWYCYSSGEIARRYHLKKKTVYNMLYQMRKEFQAMWLESGEMGI